MRFRTKSKEIMRQLTENSLVMYLLRSNKNASAERVKFIVSSKDNFVITFQLFLSTNDSASIVRLYIVIKTTRLETCSESIHQY